MSDGPAKIARLELLLANLLDDGTWVASAVIGLGLCVALMGGHSGLRIVTVGIALFILLPVLRVILMLIVFVRERDYRFAAIAALVLIIILLGFVVGMRMTGGAQ